MKKQEHLFEAIGQVDDRLVEEAADARRMATPWKKWVAMAASLVMLAPAALIFRFGQPYLELGIQASGVKG